MITSHEQELDFHHLYSGLVEIADQLEINFKPKFIIQDACGASYDAAIDVFGVDVVILMCFYHVKANLLKHAHLRDKDRYDEFEEDVNDLHFSVTEDIYKDNLRLFKSKFSESEPEIYAYFENQWLTGNFNKWQIFRNDPGFANTNSNIESFINF